MKRAIGRSRAVRLLLIWTCLFFSIPLLVVIADVAEDPPTRSAPSPSSALPTRTGLCGLGEGVVLRLHWVELWRRACRVLELCADLDLGAVIISGVRRDRSPAMVLARALAGRPESTLPLALFLKVGVRSPSYQGSCIRFGGRWHRKHWIGICWCLLSPHHRGACFVRLVVDDVAAVSELGRRPAGGTVEGRS